jgi:hypothetical protein
VVPERVVEVARDAQALDRAGVRGGGGARNPLARGQRGRGERERLEAGERRAAGERRPVCSASKRTAIVADCSATQAVATPPDTTPGSWLATTTKIAAVTTPRPNHTMATAASDCAASAASAAWPGPVRARHAAP